MHSDNIGKQFHLFHGTGADLSVGDVITPQGDSKVAYATSSSFVAQGVANIRAGRENAKIYVVKRTDPDELTNDPELAKMQSEQQKQGWSHESTHMSKKGFVVTDTNWLDPKYHNPEDDK